MKRKKKANVNFMTERSFNDMIKAPFQFIIQEFKPLFFTILKYAGPYFVLALLLLTPALISFSNISFGLHGGNNALSIVFLLIFTVFTLFAVIIAVSVIIAIIYSYISLYVICGKGNFTVNNVGKIFKKNVFKILGGGILIVLMYVSLYFLLIIPVIGTFVFYLFHGVFCWLSVSFSLYAVIIIHEQKSIGESFLKSFQLIKGNWWFSFGIYIALNIILMFGIYGIYWIYETYENTIQLGTSTYTPVSADLSIVGILIIIIVSVILFFTMFFIIITLQHSLFSFQYFNLLVRKESVDLSDRISAINENDSSIKKEPG